MSDFDALITQAAAQHNIDPSVFRALLMRESSMNPNAVSPAGAQGIAQFMPGTAAQFGIDPFNPQQAIPAAAMYLRQNLNRFGGDYQKALAAYNWGPGNVAKFGIAGAPPSVQRYVASLLGPNSRVTSPAGPALVADMTVPASVPLPPQESPADAGTPSLASLLAAPPGGNFSAISSLAPQAAPETPTPALGRRMLGAYSLADVLTGARNA